MDKNCNMFVSGGDTHLLVWWTGCFASSGNMPSDDEAVGNGNFGWWAVLSL